MSDYSNSSIQSLNILEAIRMRYGMYIGDIGPHGTLHLMKELLSNSIDEMNMGYGEIIYFLHDSHTHKVISVDNGRGLPQGKIVDVFSKGHTGGKFDKKAYRRSGGLNGLGCKAINAFAKYMNIFSVRDDILKFVRFENGDGLVKYETEVSLSDRDALNKLKNDMNLHILADRAIEMGHGTYVEYIPDEKHLRNVNVDMSDLQEYLEFSAATSRGKISYYRSEKNVVPEILEYPSNMVEAIDIFALKYLKKEGVKVSVNTPKFYIDVQSPDEKMGCKAVVYLNSGERSVVLSSMGQIKIKSGTHLTGFKTAITQTFINLARQKAPKGLVITGADMGSLFSAYMLLDMEEPSYKNQTKDELLNPELTGFIRDSFKGELEKFANQEKAIFDKIIAKIIQSAKIRKAVADAKANVIKATTGKVDAINMTKYIECLEKDPEKRELWICEGDSAAGATKTAAYDNQAVVKTFGKVTNSWRTNDLSEIQKLVIKVIGCGTGDKKDYSKLRFKKIFINADADSDGAHITTLWSGFFYKYFPELIEMGVIYRAVPPLFVIHTTINGKKKELYVRNKSAYKKFIFTLINDGLTLTDSCYTELSDDIFEYITFKAETYYNDMNKFSKMVNIPAELLEYIVLLSDDFNKLKPEKKVKIKANTIVDSIPLGNSEMVVLLSDDYYEIEYKGDHFSISTFDYKANVRDIKESAYKNMLAFGYNLKTKKTNKRVEVASLYALADYISNFVEKCGIKVTIQRLKGLGEMNPGLIRRSLLDPKTRLAIQLTTKDGDRNQRYFEALLGKDIESKKYFFTTGKMA